MTDPVKLVAISWDWPRFFLKVVLAAITNLLMVAVVILADRALGWWAPAMLACAWGAVGIYVQHIGRITRETMLARNPEVVRAFDELGEKTYEEVKRDRQTEGDAR